MYVRVAAASGTAEAPLVGAWTSQVAGMTLPPAIPVTIPDPGLRAAVTAALGKRAGDPVTRRELSTLGRLEARSAQIVDLTGLEWATGCKCSNLRRTTSRTSPAGGFDRTGGSQPLEQQRLGPLGAGEIDGTGTAGPELQQHLGHLATGWD